MDSEDLVREYVKNRDPKLREQIIIQFLPIVKYVLGRMQLFIKNKTELEDIHSAGIVGLIHALEDFDPSKNTKFKTYATLRVRGFILDYLREIDFISRSDRAKIRKIEKIIPELMKQNGREPTDQEIAQQLHVDLAEYYRLLELTHLNFTVTFDQTQHIKGEEIKLSDIIADNSNKSPLEEFSKKNILNLVKQAIRQLPQRERMIVLMYYNDEMTLAEIAKVLSLSESRVSRLLGKAMLSIRNQMKKMVEQTKITI